MQSLGLNRVGRRVSAVFILSISLSLPTRAPAQDVGGFINLLGHVMENDIRQQQEKRRIQQEELRYQQQQQMIRQAEQAEIDARRRAEILLIKRVQAALSKLGYYKSKIDGDRGPVTQAAENLFTTAFELPPISLTEADVQQVEGLAAAGFRNRNEIRRAASGGFQSRDELVAAEAGGFSTAFDYASAKQAGFDSLSAYQAFQASGFPTGEAFRKASQGGFSDPKEFGAASQAGFADRSEYRAFVESKLPDRAAFVKAQEAIAAIDAASTQCSDGADDADVKKALAACMRAVSLGADARPVHDAFDTIGARLRQQLEDAARPATKALQTQVATAGEPTQELNPKAGEFLVERVALQEALGQHECGAAMLSKNWQEAKAKCVSSTGQADATIDMLHARADENLVAVQQEAQKEQDRLALASARDHMSTLIADISDFMQAKRTLIKPLDVAKAVVRLKQLQESEDSNAIEQAILNIDELLAAEEDYQKFLKERVQAKEIAETNAKATAIAEIRRTEAFIEDYIARNLLSDSINDLLALQAKLAEARASDQQERVFNGQKLAKNEIERLGLTKEMASFVFEATEPKAKSVEQASNGLALTDSNRVLLEGDAKDVLILGNFTAQAPHLIVNLLGETTFDEGTVDYCWLGGGSEAPLPDYVLPALRALGADTLISNQACTSASILQNDIILLPRGEFLQGNVLEARPVVEAFESQQIKLIKAILWADVGASANREAEVAETIRTEVIAGVRKGFGLVSFGNKSVALCMVVPSTEIGPHTRALAINEAALSRYLAPGLKPSAVSLDRAFAGVQKNDCRAVYASETDLARLLEALKRIQTVHSVVPVWIEPAVIAEGEALAQQSDEEQKKEIAARKQEIEAQEAVAKKQSEDAGKQRELAQAELRNRYSQEAKAAFNDLSEMSETFLRSTDDKPADFPQLFPAIGQWKGERRQAGWEFDKYEGTLLDYGTAEWKGRRLESVLVEISVTTKNPVRGEYSKDCFVVGYLIDQEFNMLRDAVAETCSASQEVLEAWRSSRDFESRWVAR